MVAIFFVLVEMISCVVGSVDAARGLALNPTIGKLSLSALAGKQGSLAVFEYQLLEAATNHFSETNILSEGGYGLVYKAHFSEKFIAAVKKLDNVGLDPQRGFEVPLPLIGVRRLIFLLLFLFLTRPSIFVYCYPHIE